MENPGYITDPSDAAEIMDVLAATLFAVEIDQDRYDYFLYTVFLDSPEEDPTYARGLWRQEWENYQNTGDDATVRNVLERSPNEKLQRCMVNRARAAAP